MGRLWDSIIASVAENCGELCTGAVITALLGAPVLTFFCTKNYLNDVAEAETKQAEERAAAGCKQIEVPLPLETKLGLGVKNFWPVAADVALGVASAVTNETHHNKVEDTLISALNTSLAGTAVLKDAMKEKLTTEQYNDVIHETRSRVLELPDSIKDHDSERFDVICKAYEAASDSRVQIMYDCISEQYLLASPEDIERVRLALDKRLDQEKAIFLIDWCYELANIYDGYKIPSIIQDTGWKRQFNYFTLGGHFNVYLDPHRMENGYYVTALDLDEAEWIH